METLKEVLMRTEDLSEEEASDKINSLKHCIEVGEDPVDVLVEEFGEDIEHCQEILNPKDTDGT